MESVIKVAIVAIGTEITTGQISDTNSSWISEKLTNLRCNIVVHLSVPDTPDLIQKALELAEQLAPTIIVTGGLGPTSDDITRNVISEWCQEELVYDSNSWEQIVSRLTTVGVDPAQSNKQQCYFPQGAEILTNHQGTANAFVVKKSNSLECIVLPGPPREISDLWQRHLHSRFSEKTAKTDALKLFTWHTLGKSESALADIVEDAVKNSTLITGYRPHRPYVEIKIWCLESELDKNQQSIARLDKALSPWTATRDGQDLADNFLTKLTSAKEVHIIDEGTAGTLTERLGKVLRSPDSPYADLELTITNEWGPDSNHTVDNAMDVLEMADPEVLTLAIGPINPNGYWEVGRSYQGKRKVKKVQCPWKVVKGTEDRLARLITELSIQFFLEQKFIP